ncbi:EAL domain-containing protein [uncultured Aquitalea sp.]|uniref:EAL domain-containing protein n=1 Tax=uncultured Aquitalea sp. TaxID=540272 RepID=UPI0025E5BDE5|nr:EAL domain-containing protein [uncultured Aquitalea sp.]
MSMQHAVLPEMSFSGAFATCRFLPAGKGDWRIAEAKGSLAALYGVSPEEVCRQPESLTRAVHPEDMPALAGLLNRSRMERTRWQLEHRVLLDGREGWRQIMVEPDGDEAWLAVMIDVGDRRHFREQWALTWTRLDRLLKIADMAYWEWDAATDSMFYSPAFLAQLGYRPGAFGADHQEFQSRVHPDDLAVFLESDQRLLEDGHEDSTVEYRMRHRDGEWRSMISHSCLVRDGQGNPMFMAGVHTDVTEARRLESSLKQSEALLRKAQETGRIGCYITDCDNLSWKSTPVLNEIFGLREGVHFSNEEWLKLVPAEQHEPMLAAINSGLLENGGFSVDYQIVRPDNGQRRWLSEVGSLQRDAEGAPREIIGTVQDITERKEREQALHLAAQVFENGRDAVMITDPDLMILRVNRAFVDMTGIAGEQCLGLPLLALYVDFAGAQKLAQIEKALAAEGHWQGELWARRQGGDTYTQWLSVTEVRDADGHVCNFIASATDVSARKAADEHIRRLAYFDVLTALPNRTQLMERSLLALERAGQANGELAVLFLDFDHFKTINDSLGHSAGDQLIIAAAGRLQQHIRGTDIIARLGGDEFVILLTDCGRDGAGRVAQELIAEFEQPFRIQSHDLHIGCSIGISLYPGDAGDFESLLRHADAALYQAKDRGRNRHAFFTRNIGDDADERLTMENSLRRALAEAQFELYFQPKLDLARQQVTGLEALLRWNHPQLGLVGPDKFIPIAERNGLIVQIGDWVLMEACRQAMRLQAAGWPKLPVAVNVSPFQIHHGQLFDSVLRALDTTGLPPELLELEVTEGLLVEASESSLALFHRLRERNVTVSIDDFGTGYSSLAYLRKLPIDRIKIDRSFVSDIQPASDALSIVEAIVGLGHALSLTVVAEGVETGEQARLLAEAGADQGQGYLFARPMPAAQCENWLTRFHAGLETSQV